MRFGLSVFVALLSGFGLVSISSASQPVYQIDAKIVGPAGQDWGSHALVTSSNQGAWKNFERGGESFKLGITVTRESAPGCHVLGIQFEQTAPKQNELMLQTEACAGKSVEFNGAPIGGPRLTISLAKSR